MRYYKTFLFFTLIFIDFFSKYFLIDFLPKTSHYIYHVNDFLSFAFMWNHGISFGVFSDYKQYSNYIFIIVSALIVLYIIYYVKQNRPKKIENFGLYLILIGALGNLIDRIIYGAVFDFISVKLFDYYMPVFNIADSYISIGAFIVFLGIIFDKNENEFEKKNNL